MRSKPEGAGTGRRASDEGREARLTFGQPLRYWYSKDWFGSEKRKIEA